MKAQRPEYFLSEFAAVGCFSAAFIALIGWAFHIEQWTSILPSWPKLVPVTAVGLVLSAASLWLYATNAKRNGTVASALAYIVLTLGMSIAAFRWLEWAPAPFLISPSAKETPFSLSSSVTALMFVAIGTSLVLSKRKTSIGIAQSVAMGLLLTALLTVLGYISQDTFLYRMLPGKGTSILTTFAFAALSAGTLFLHPSQAIMAPLLGDMRSAQIARPLLLLTLGIPITLGLATILGIELGFYDVNTAISFLIWGLTTLFTIVILRLARKLYLSDIARDRAEEDLKRTLDNCYHLANHDTLTGLANRAKFNDGLQSALSHAQRSNHIVAIHLLDLDRFKAINDTFGHHAGDVLLKEVADRIKAHTRATDVVARLGGDEFVIVQSDLTAPTAATILAEKIVDELGRTFLLEGTEVQTGTSIGISLFPSDAEDPQNLVRLADLALYEAKNRGRHNFQFYKSEIGAAVDETLQLEQNLRLALKDDQFHLHYQPQYDLKNGRIAGVEVLLRWQHPEKGLLPASQFIREAESLGIMPSIGEWTLRTACRRHQNWVRIGLVVPLVVNVSLRQLRHSRFLQSLKDILDETRLPPSMLQLELKESVLWDLKQSTSLLNEVKSIGVRISLDDFGTEFAALSSLHKFPLDVVKPSPSLVRELPHKTREAAVLSAVMSVANERKIAVCAGGIETSDQLTAVKEYGCDSAQGFLLSSPLSENEMDQLIKDEISRY